jgi:citrate synthase
MRQNMRNTSGASRIDPQTQVAELHGIPIVELTDYPLESLAIFSLTKRFPENDIVNLVNISLNYLSKISDVERLVWNNAKENYATPNAALSAVMGLLGNQKQFKIASSYMDGFIEVFTKLSIRDLYETIYLQKALSIAKEFFPEGDETKSEFANFLIENLQQMQKRSAVLQFALEYVKNNNPANPDLFLISAVLMHSAFQSLVFKRITRDTAENMLTYLSVMAKTVMLTSDYENIEILNSIQQRQNLDDLNTSFSKTAYLAIFNEAPGDESIKEFTSLLALTLTNGPGTISAKGAKESVSARNNITASFVGFLTNTGLSHGGNGYEAVKYLLDSFKNYSLEDPAENIEKERLQNVARQNAKEFLKYKNDAKLKGLLKYKRIPCVNHPVFKGKRVNTDPREDFIRKKLNNTGIKNAFWDYYHFLVKELYNIGATPNVYCVNIDAVIAVISLKLMWKSYKEGKIKEEDMQNIGFYIFLIGRTVGIAAEIADHRDRGLDMDCRTPVKETKFVV